MNNLREEHVKMEILLDKILRIKIELTHGNINDEERCKKDIARIDKVVRTLSDAESHFTRENEVLFPKIGYIAERSIEEHELLTDAMFQISEFEHD